MVYKKYTQKHLMEMADMKEYPNGVVGVAKYKNGKLHLIHDKNPKIKQVTKEKKERNVNVYKAGSDEAKQRGQKASKTRARRKEEKMDPNNIVNKLLGL